MFENCKYKKLHEVSSIYLLGILKYLIINTKYKSFFLNSNALLLFTFYVQFYISMTFDQNIYTYKYNTLCISMIYRILYLVYLLYISYHLINSKYS